MVRRWAGPANSDAVTDELVDILWDLPRTGVCSSFSAILKSHDQRSIWPSVKVVLANPKIPML